MTRQYKQHYRESYQGQSYDGRNNYHQKSDGFAKKSGCKMSNHTRNGEEKLVLHGWNVSKRDGFMTFVAAPAKTGVCEGHSGAGDFIRMIARVSKAKSEPFLTSCFFYPQTNCLKFPDLNMVGFPKAKNGGYWGTSNFGR